MADVTPPSESPADQIQRLLDQDRSSRKDVSRETSPESEEEPEQSAATQDSDEPLAEADEAAEGEEAAEQGDIRSLADLAKHLELGEEDLAKHLMVSGPDGKEVSLHEALSAFRAPAPDKAEGERTRARLAELEAGEQQRQGALQELARAAQGLAQRLKAQQPNWAELKARDPAQYTAARLEWMEHLQHLEQADRHLQAEHQKAAEQQQRQLLEFRREEARKLQAIDPAWKDGKVFEAEIGKTERYLLDTWKLKPEDLQGLADHRDWAIATKARLWDELQAKKPKLIEKVKQLPKLAPGPSSGADRGTGARRASAEAEMLGRLKETGDPRDAAALITSALQRSQKSAAGRRLATGRRT